VLFFLKRKAVSLDLASCIKILARNDENRQSEKLAREVYETYVQLSLTTRQVRWRRADLGAACTYKKPTKVEVNSIYKAKQSLAMAPADADLLFTNM
jgi:hypothetical protein